jgi:azurin
MRYSTLLIFVVLLSCSSEPKKTEPTTEPTAPATSDLMKEEPAYSSTTIDPNAKVDDISLEAQGNTMTEMKYDKSEIKVKAGTTLHFKFKNEGKDAAMVHNFVLIEEGTADAVAAEALKAGPSTSYIPSMKQVLYGSKLLQPQEETEFSIPAPAKGAYDFICTYPGHYKMMHGKLIVE